MMRLFMLRVLLGVPVFLDRVIGTMYVVTCVGITTKAALVILYKTYEIGERKYIAYVNDHP